VPAPSESVNLLVAGHETTVNLIGSGTLELLQHPDQMKKLRRDPTLIKSAVEELLRYTAPVFMSTERYAREDVTIQGVTIPRGEMTLGVIGSANRDGRKSFVQGFGEAPRQCFDQAESRPPPLVGSPRWRLMVAGLQ
jgi:Cytochrome P450